MDSKCQLGKKQRKTMNSRHSDTAKKFVDSGALGIEVFGDLSMLLLDKNLQMIFLDL